MYDWQRSYTDFRSVNPLQVRLQGTGYTRSSSHEFLYKSHDGTSKILKSSPRYLVEQFSIYESHRLTFSVASHVYATRQIKLHLSNNYEHKQISISFNQNRWLLVGRVVQYLNNDEAFLAVALALLTCLLLLYSARPIIAVYKSFKRSIERCWRTNKIVMGEEAINLQERIENEISDKLLNDVCY